MNEIVEKALKLLRKKKIGSGEVYVENSSRLEVEVRNGEVETYNERNLSALAVRVIIKGRPGFSYSFALEDSDIEKAVSDAILMAGYSQVDSNLELCPGGLSYSKVNSFSKEIAEYPLSGLIENAIKMEEAAKSYDRRITGFRKIKTSRLTGEVFLASTTGLSAERNYSMLAGMISPVARQGDEQQIARDAIFTYDASSFDTVKCGVEAARNAVEKLGARDFRTGRFDVILSPEVTSEILAAIVPALYGEQALKGKSLFADSTGKRIGSTAVNLVDDALVEGGFTRTPFDDEGTPCGKTVVIENGYLKTFLHNRKSARAFHTVPTGNGFKASLEMPPATSSTNLYLGSTGETREEIMKTVSECVLVTDAMNLHSIDPISGDFSIGITGHYVKNGEKQYPVKGLAIAGNVRELLNSIRMVGTDRRFFPGTTAGSTVFLEGLSVSGRKE